MSLLNDSLNLLVDVNYFINETVTSISTYLETVTTQPLFEFVCGFLYIRRACSYVFESFEFSDFQSSILKVLLSLLFLNTLLIFIAWHFFGRQIVERFSYFATARAIEELKASVARLKLPKVYLPRN